MTEKLYYEDSSLRRFAASVLGCTPADGGFDVELDRTAFFPGGGGQPCDLGMLGGLAVLGCREENGVILHHTEEALPVGSIVTGELDWSRRLRFSQGHSAEHIVSGTARRLFGCSNVGFHMAEDGCVTLDFDRELDAEQLRTLEDEANGAVFQDVPVTTRILPPSAQPSEEYRSKHAIEGELRIVNMEGIDVCACCAPHVRRTGEIGLIRLSDAMRHRGGVRLTLRAGLCLLDSLRRQEETLGAVVRLLSAPAENLAEAVERLLAERDRLRHELGERERDRLRRRAAELTATEGNLCLFEDGDPASLRELAAAGAALCTGLCAVFTGDDTEGYRYVICARDRDMRSVAAVINAALEGRGGGSGGLIQGSVKAPRSRIEAFLTAWYPFS